MRIGTTLAIVLPSVPGRVTLFFDLRKETAMPYHSFQQGKYICCMLLLLLLLAACSSGTAPTQPQTKTTKAAGNTHSGPTPTPTPAIAPGTVLYQANWSHGLDGWKGSPGWSVVDGELQADTSDTTSIYTPYMPSVANYTVEARVRVVSLKQKNGGYYSIFASQVPGKDGFQAGVSDLKGPGPRPNGSNAQLQIYIEPFGAMAPGSFHPSDNDPGTQWHTYAVAVQGNEATLYVDGIAVTTATSTETDTLSNGPLGISCGSVVLLVSSFKITAL
jgi:hypothetical protein